MTKANERQVGGSHYKKGEGDQHWDIVDRYNVPYLEGVGSKYPLRWREKGGIEDLEKTLHYIDKILESPDSHLRWERPHTIKPGLAKAVEALVSAHETNKIEREVIWALLRGVERNELVAQRHLLASYIAELRQNQPGTPEDGGHHARQVEIESVVVHHHHTHIVLPEGCSGNIHQVGEVLKAEWGK